MRMHASVLIGLPWRRVALLIALIKAVVHLGPGVRAPIGEPRYAAEQSFEDIAGP